MARSLWIGALVGLLACTAAGRAAVLPQERIITLRETGKPPVKCRVLKCWLDRELSKICEVQAVDSGERMTIVEKQPTGDVATGGVCNRPLPQVYHWGASATPPRGAPVAPPDAIVVSQPTATKKQAPATAGASKVAPATATAAKAAPAAPAADAGKAKTDEGIITLKATASHPELKCRVVKEWTEKDGSKTCQYQVIATGEMMTVTEPRSAASPKSGISGFLSWGSHDKPKSEPVVQTSASVVSTTTTAVPATKPAVPAITRQRGDRIVRIMEAGHKEPEQCRVIKEWSTRDGGKASQLQLLETGEMITMTEPRPGTGTTRVFHWGEHDTPPAGAPVATLDAVVVSAPIVLPKPSLLQASASPELKPTPAPEVKPVSAVETKPALTTSAPAVQERVVKIMEANSKQPLVCRVIKEWTNKDGSKGCQLQVVATGEMISMAQPKGGAGSTRVFHWGTSGKPPRGAPVPPKDAVVAGTPAPASAVVGAPSIEAKPSLLQTVPEASKTQVPGEQIVTVTESGSKKPQKCRVVKEWTNKDGTKACQLQVIATGEMMTMTTSGPGADPKTDASHVYHWEGKNSPPAGAPVAPSDADPVPAPKRTFLKRLFGSSHGDTASVTTATTPVTTVTTPSVSVPAPKSQTVVKTEPLPMGEWGKVESWKKDDVKKPDGTEKSVDVQPYVAGGMSSQPTDFGATKPAPVEQPFTAVKKTAQPSLLGPATPLSSGQPFPADTSSRPSLFGSEKTAPAGQPFSMETTSRPSLPMAETSHIDPLSQPQAYVKTTVPGSTPATHEPPVAPAGKPMPSGPAVTAPSGPPAGAASGEKSNSPMGMQPMPSGAPAVSTAPAPVSAPKTVSSTIIPGTTTTSGTMIPSTRRPSTTYEEPTPARPSLWGMLTGRNPAPASEPVRMVVRKSEPAATPATEMAGRSSTPASESVNTVAHKSAPKENVPMGMGSVMAAGMPAVNSVSKPIAKVVVMDGQSEMKAVNSSTIPGSISIPVTAPNAFTMAMGAPAGMPGPMMPPGPVMMPSGPMVPGGMMMAQAAPPGMNNAFTTGGNTRPIPADMGMAAADPNAFEHGGMSQPVRQQVAMMPPGYYPYPMPMPMPMPRMPAAAPMPAMAQAPVQEPQTGLLIAALHNSVLPSEREMAVEQLSQYDWRMQPQLVAALTSAAKNDPAATVRASCVHALAKMKVNTLPAVQTVQALKNDKDVRVRQEVEQALAIMSH